MISFKDKTILLTGAAHGIGRELAKLFAKDGATLVLWDRDEKALDKLQYKLSEMGDCEVHYRAFDLLDDQKLKLALNDVMYYSGNHPDIIVNNAGVGSTGPLESTSEDEWAFLNKLHVEVPRKIIRALLPGLKSRNGSIVNVSSGQSFFMLPSWGAYAISKRTMAAYSELLSIELINKVDVLTVYPFMVNTGFYDTEKKKANTWAGQMSMKLLPYYSNKPETVAKKIYRAIQKRKVREFVHPINWVGYYLDTIPDVGDLVRLIASAFLNRSS